MVYENEDEVRKVIEEAISENAILLFVKGSPDAPMCGFSKGVMDVFSHLGAQFQTIDVLQDPLVREGIKKFTNWPTIPQVFIKGQFIGGFDIVRDLFEKGELQGMIESAQS